MTTPNACNRKRPSPHCAAPVPVQASSGRTIRHRLNRGGNRQANNALWRIAITRMRYDQTTIAYAQKRQTEGKNRREDHPLPETPHRPGDLPPAHQPTRNPQRRPSSLSTQKRANNPHPRRHSPTKPTQYASHNSSEASTTTINSPPDTTNGSPPSHPTKTRFDNHRSITQWDTARL